VPQPLQAIDDTVAACKERAAVAQVARRRPDLEAARIQRLQLESNHDKATADRARQGRALLEFASGLGLPADSTAVAAESLRQWVGDQEARRQALTKRREDAATLNQVLNGGELPDLQTELATSIENAGPEPDPDAMPADLDKFRADAVGDHDSAINMDGHVKGRIQTLGNELASVAEAVEEEADAERAVEQGDRRTQSRQGPSPCLHRAFAAGPDAALAAPGDERPISRRHHRAERPDHAGD